MSLEIKRFIDCYVPTEVCNFQCTYCYIGQRKGFTGSVHAVGRTKEEVRQALSKKRFGGIMFLNFCAGGETLLGEDILGIIYELLKEGHVVQIVTNGTLRKRFEEISGWEDELLSRLFIKFSFHFLELKRLRLLDVFFSNIKLMQENGVSISLEITPCDEMIPYIEEIKACSIERAGALPHITVARNVETAELKILSSLSKEDYVKTWGQFDSPLFDMKMELVSQKRYEYCYAGEWTLYLDLRSGDLKQCYKGDVIDNIYWNPLEPIHFKPIGRHCRESYCFNGHAWLTWGAIPDMKTPTYAQIRNRVMSHGGEWLSDTVKQAFSCRLKNLNTVYENTDSVPKVLMLGDSILAGYVETVRKNLGNKCYIYYNGEIARSSVYLYRYLSEWADNMRIGSNIDVVHFNVGLWDIIHLNDEEPLVDIGSYEKNLRRIVWQLKYLFPNAKLVFANITPVAQEEWYFHNYRWERKNQDIDDYNKIAAKVMQENHVFENDLYTLAKGFHKEDYEDATHFTQNAYRQLGEKVSDCIGKMIDKMENAAAAPLGLSDSEFQNNISKLKKHRILIYGAGQYGRMCISMLQGAGITPELIIDRDIKLHGTFIQKILVIGPSEYMESECEKGDVVIIGIRNTALWNNIVSLFKECKGINVCSYKMLDYLHSNGESIGNGMKEQDNDERRIDRKTVI